ncbi:aminotransferase class V-fold PLP-dependent enzyme [Selenihalanaerobacter shriftii]|uniref:Cysteine desulfurase family protein n=1 Tax=Selenihalanaerobacter shriftii TaxID=142842 RepID=A0A1T4NEF4_9FIRM|nr:aminotransferase class V-fold PLP-dependent enzyme [Selenihalanaerobacter shriftii]SJZ77721.1 cysteine desulfurase family protein [Selenihalanaerobacter shriftii]
MIYFDNAATTYPKPEEVYEFMDKFYRNHGVNAGRGAYDSANQANNLIGETRDKVANIFGINDNQEIIFTSSATEAINLVLKGIDWKEGDVVYYSPFEHNAVLRNLYFLEEKHNIKLRQIPVNDSTFEFKVDELEQMFVSESPRLVAVSQVSNVCGVIAPITRLAELVAKYDGLMMVDGAQAAGILNLDLDNIDYYIWAGHKSLYGPFGIAGVVVNKDSAGFEPLIHGGTGNASEKKSMPTELPIKYQAGSQNIQAIAGLNAAIKWLEKIEVDEVFDHDKKLMRKLIEVLDEFIDLTLYLPKNLDNHFNVLAVKVSGYSPHDFGKILDEKFDIAVRTGLHCAPKTHEFLGTLPEGLVRFSVGYFNTIDNVYALKKRLDQIIF